MAKKVIRLTEADLEKLVLQVIHEQEVQEQLKVKWSRPYTITKTKTKGNKTLEQGKVTPELPEEQWEEYVNGPEANKMVSLMKGQTPRRWEEIKENQIDFAVATIESFNESYPEKKWNKVYIPNPKEKTETIEKEPKLYPTVPMIFPNNSSPNSDFFVDNYYETTPYFKEQFKADIIDPINAQLEQIKNIEGKPKMYLKELNIATSASRIPNTESPDGKTYTFEQLSKLRNESALNYIKSQLDALGVLIDSDTVITQNYKGQNGDGTSGPEWKAGSDKSKYERYKYLNVDIKVILNIPPGIGQDPGDEEIIKTQQYKVIFKRVRKGISIKIPLFTWTKQRKRKSKGTSTNELCAAFD